MIVRWSQLVVHIHRKNELTATDKRKALGPTDGVTNYRASWKLTSEPDDNAFLAQSALLKSLTLILGQEKTLTDQPQYVVVLSSYQLHNNSHPKLTVQYQRVSQ